MPVSSTRSEGGSSRAADPPPAAGTTPSAEGAAAAVEVEVAIEVSRPQAPTSTPTPAGRRWLQVAFSLSLLLLALLVLYLIRDVAGAFVLGALLAFLILPAVDLLESRGVPRALGVLLVFAGLAGVVWLLVRATAPLFSDEVNSPIKQLPALAVLAQEQLSPLERGNQLVIFGYSIDLGFYAKEVTKNLNGFLLGQFANALGLGLTAITTLLQLLLLLIVAFLVALNAHEFSGFMRHMVPPDYRSDFDEIWLNTKRMLYAYMRGQLAVAALIGFFSTIAVWVLGLRYPLALGLLAGLSALIPYIGPYLGAVPAVLIALTIGPYQALGVAVAYVVISNVIFNFVSPRVVGSAVQLPSLLVIVAFLAGFSMAGILGMFVAVPVAAFIRIVYAHVHPRLFGV
jgi:predicted PurR-regulated permease PerM